ncbi:Sec-independent protein translocase subunit TatA [Plantactinospora sp. GCM10030261]|uniref:Sec-independent protein translocase subunit TatA n=1 Tax=Plantactinospora sp. GCM10030261 TaxID=3273420 RepID=UPI00360B6830
MGALKPWHIAVLVVVLILLFGAKRLPDAARSLGRSMRIIKAETKGLADDDKDLAEKADAQHQRQPLPPNGQQAPQGGYPAPDAGYQAPNAGYPAPPAQQPVVDPVHRVRDN